MNFKNNILLLALFLFCALSVNAQNTISKVQKDSDGGITFTTESWEDILAMAAETDKGIFLDAYASWCGPCKHMVKNVFTQYEVGKYYNDNFINVKLDMEKDDDGKRLAQKYNVKVYPTYLYFDSAGELIHMAVGAKKPGEFISDGATANDSDKNLKGLMDKYQDGDADKETLLALASSLAKANLGYEEVMEDYMSTLKSAKVLEKSDLDFVYNFTDNIDSDAFKLLMDNRSQFNESIGTEKVDRKVQTIAMKSIQRAALNKDKTQLKKITSLLEKSDPDNGVKLAQKAVIDYHRLSKDWDSYAPLAVKYYKEHATTANYSELNNVAWDFYEQVDKKKYLKQAVKWAKLSVEENEAYFNMDTYAAVLYKLGKLSDAQSAAERAIELAKASGDDYTGTLKLLNQIKKK